MSTKCSTDTYTSREPQEPYWELMYSTVHVEYNYKQYQVISLQPRLIFKSSRKVNILNSFILDFFSKIFKNAEDAVCTWGYTSIIFYGINFSKRVSRRRKPMCRNQLGVERVFLVSKNKYLEVSFERRARAHPFHTHLPLPCKLLTATVVLDQPSARE